MKICLITEHFYPHIGGVETVFFEYAKRLTEKGVEIRVLTSNSGGIIGKVKQNGFSIFYYNCHSLFTHSLLSKKDLVEHVKWADIVHTTTLTACLSAIKACQKYKKPCILMVHEVIGKRWFKIEKNPLKAFLFLLYEKFAIKKSYTFWQAISKATKNDMLKIGIPENKIELIYHGIDSSFWNKDVPKIDINNFFSFNDNSNVFLYAGRPGKTKGIFILLEAIQKLKTEIPSNFKFGLILGKEPKKERQAVENFIQKNHLENLLKIKDSLSLSKLASLKKSAFTVIVPSLTEGFGFSAVETSALEVPLISSDAGSLPEVISGKFLLFKSGNAEDLAQKILLATENNFNCLPYRKFDWEESIEKLVKLYRKILCV